MAAVLACGDGALLSHRSASALHGLVRTASVRVDVTITRPSPISRAGIAAHRRETITETDRTSVAGIPVTSVARTLLDLATILTASQLERACEQAVLEGVFDMRAMSELLGRSRGVRGIRRLRAVLALGDLGEDVPASGLERRYRELCGRAGLPKPELNRYLLLGDGYHKVDFLWRKERVVIETDGARYHSTGWQRRRDSDRDSLLDAHGFRHARISEKEIEMRPGDAVQRAARLLRQPGR